MSLIGNRPAVFLVISGMCSDFWWLTLPEDGGKRPKDGGKMAERWQKDGRKKRKRRRKRKGGMWKWDLSISV